jgi:hypothetical protein
LGAELDFLAGALARGFVIVTVAKNAGFGVPTKRCSVNAMKIADIRHLIVLLRS